MSESNNNEEFVYPELTGRRRIYSDVDKITEENIFEVLQKAMIVHMQNSNEMVFLMRYEKGIQPLVRNKTIRTLDTGAPVFEKVTLTPNPVDCGKTFVISVKVTD